MQHCACCILTSIRKKIAEENNWPSAFNDYLSQRIAARKSELSKYATQENHGIDIKYLRK